MDEFVVRFRVGVMVVATFIISGILILLFGEVPTLVRGTKTVYLVFPQAPNVSVDTPVRKSGILIGRVTAVDFDENDAVVVTARLYRGYKVRQNETCRISSGLLGDAAIEFVPSNDPSLPRDEVADGARIPGVVLSDPLVIIGNLEGQLNATLTSFTRAADDVSRVANRLDGVLGANDEQFARMLAKGEKTLDTFEQTASSINRLLSDPELEGTFKDGIKQLPQVISDTRQAMTQMKEAMASVQRTADSADRNLQNFEDFTKSIGDRGPEVVDRLNTTVARFDELLEQLVVFSRKLNESDGSLGQLVNNPDLYQNLNRAAENIEQLTRQLRPIMDDARIISDKIARDPGGEIGVRSLLQKSGGLKNGGRTGWQSAPARLQKDDSY
jgi:phospholipid/cholesterol/gamma-HCH transport system substrate-binding protein